MPEGTTIQIPIKPYLKKYLLRKLKAKEDSIVISTNDTIGFGICVINTISKKRDYLLNPNIKNIESFINKINIDNTFINLSICEGYCKTSGYFIKDDKVFYINKFIEKQFRNDLMMFLLAPYFYNPKFIIEYGLEDFLSIYSISEDEIKKESLVRYFRRENKKYSFIN